MYFLKKIADAQESLSEDALSHLKTYKYSSVDKSFISRYILKHYWNAFVELLPLWLAPNMVTLIGFMFIIGNLILLEIAVPDLIGPAPAWVYYSFGMGVWMYSTMDNVDGKQARRTGTSSGLGELFDHGIDSLNCTLASLLQVAAMGQGSTKIGAFTTLLPCLPMFFSTWETYHTHTLYLGYINGPTEGLIIGVLMMIASGYYGPHIYSNRVADTLGYPSLFGNWTYQELFIFVLGFSFLTAHFPACVYNVIRVRNRQNLPILPIFLEWIPAIVASASAVCWLYSPYSSLLSANRLVLFAITMCFVIGRMTTKIILAHLTRQPFPYWTILISPLIGGAILGNLPRFGFPQISPSLELLYLRAYLVFAFVTYMHWAYFVVHRITTYLGINCLTIKHDKPKAREQDYRQLGEGRIDAGNARPDPFADSRVKAN
ncbi:sn-1,2-diacylglycerol cholinephosphotransferase [Histoplasma capsulatum var. duboisii H88]|uniref:sn-1,2-diacylglycerol cholinephosphotransferase n=2 Tax=Ajellomyces capsulatus TaxID=5037 RepID=F0UEG5_AJEC8|nr:sn-1,2-diacylglycerol cholinephosphotransferase [Histoplasma capsulatum H143]EGC44695.1 sn-1,2-diacylglycerol cholinephosphotransferase [Histoplasma capsulatum var. duboisii H88]QSS55468.1 sn-1,2-diacylglycerol cholinephosphotransferase [Histoplasma capsulatum var. duboisii H88]